MPCVVDIRAIRLNDFDLKHMLLGGQLVEVFMIVRFVSGMVGTVAIAGMACATAPQVNLGPKPSFGLFQPRVTVEVFADEAGQQSLGPSSASSFLLDTGATSTLIFSSASEQLKAAGYVVEGTFDEIGISGVQTFDVSAPYVLHVGDSTIDFMRPEQYKFSLPCTLQLARATQDVASALPEGIKKQLDENLAGLGLSPEELLQSLNIFGDDLSNGCKLTRALSPGSFLRI